MKYILVLDTGNEDDGTIFADVDDAASSVEIMVHNQVSWGVGHTSGWTVRPLSAHIDC